MNEIMTQLFRRGLTVVSNRRGYGLYYTKGDTLQFLELQADNDHCADLLLQAAGKNSARRMPVSCLRRTRPCIWGRDGAAGTA